MFSIIFVVLGFKNLETDFICTFYNLCTKQFATFFHT